MKLSSAVLLQVQRNLITELAQRCQVGIDNTQRHLNADAFCACCKPVAARLVIRLYAIRDLCQLALLTSGLKPSPLPERDLEIIRGILAQLFEAAKRDEELDQAKIVGLRAHIHQQVRAW